MTMSGSSLRLRIRSDSDATRSLIAVSNFARDLGFSKYDCHAISTSVSELARNILKYAGNGEILLEEAESQGGGGLQVTARDRGPGIEDVDAAMRDHYSSSGTLGLGLPGVKRLMDEFEIDTAPGQGTRVVIRKWREAKSKPVRSVLLDAARRASLRREAGTESEGALPRDEKDAGRSVDCAFFVRPCRGERVSGDLGVVERRGAHIFIAIIDALGHGRRAHEIAKRAAMFLRASWKPDLAQTMNALHEALRGTDGAAAGLCVVDVSAHAVRYVGVGNTVIRTLGKKERRVFSTPGTLGHQIRSPREQRLALESGDLLMLYTDGVKERFELEDYPQLRYQDARTIARTVVKRFGKDYDDASCVVVRYDA
jgi:anti-sigma regulatory factor (Ser/Thr protein kinase)